MDHKSGRGLLNNGGGTESGLLLAGAMRQRGRWRWLRTLWWGRLASRHNACAGWLYRACGLLAKYRHFCIALARVSPPKGGCGRGETIDGRWRDRTIEKSIERHRHQTSFAKGVERRRWPTGKADGCDSEFGLLRPFWYPDSLVI